MISSPAKTTQTTPIDPAEDRLSRAKKLADELSDSRLWKTKISYQKRWTKLRRDRKSIEIQYTKPWLRSTGPKTPMGKLRSSRNGGVPDIASKMANRALRVHGWFLQRLNLLVRCRKRGIALPEVWLEETKALGNRATAMIMLANALIRVTGRNNE